MEVTPENLFDTTLLVSRRFGTSIVVQIHFGILIAVYHLGPVIDRSQR